MILLLAGCSNEQLTEQDKVSYIQENNLNLSYQIQNNGHNYFFLETRDDVQFYVLYGKDNGGYLTSHTTIPKDDFGIYYGGTYPGSTGLYITNKLLLDKAATFKLKIDGASIEYQFNEKYYILEHENIMKFSHSLEFFDVDGNLLYKNELLL